MGGTLKSQMDCGCEFWEKLDHAGEMQPSFEPCEEHYGIRERQLKGALQTVLGHSNCYCDECKELAKHYWKPKPGDSNLQKKESSGRTNE